jgi:hypothetical protein
MADQAVVERLEDEVMRLRAAVEGALVFALDVEAGIHGEQAAMSVVTMLNRALDAGQS